MREGPDVAVEIDSEFTLTGGSVSGSSPFTVNVEPLASTSRPSIVRRSSAYCNGAELIIVNGRPFQAPMNDSIVAVAISLLGRDQIAGVQTVARSCPS